MRAFFMDSPLEGSQYSIRFKKYSLVDPLSVDTRLQPARPASRLDSPGVSYQLGKI
jgi:hypothetical protein